MGRVVEIANGFPPGLNTANAATDLPPSETPDSYGLDLLKFDCIAKAAIPTGTARIAKTFAIGETTYNYAYGRLFYFHGTTLDYGAPGYIDTFYRQNSGILPFDEDTNSILSIVPFGADSMLVTKATGSYVLSNCADSRALFQKTDIIQGLKVSGADRATTMNGMLFVSNANGLMSYQQGQVIDLTEKVRNDVTNFSNVALTLNYERGLVIGGTSFVYDMNRKALYRFDGTNFRYTTPVVRNKDYAPFSVDALIISIAHTDRSDGSLAYQIKLEDGDWSEEYTAQLPYTEEAYSLSFIPLEDVFAVRKWQLRITDIVGGKQIKGISVEADNYNLWSYSK